MADPRNYQIKERVATGGTAVLYRAVQTSLDRVVAVKKLHQHLTTDENFTRRFILEAKAAASLDHENIVKIIDFGVEDDSYMMVMEFIEGESLKDVLEKWRQIPPNFALALVHQVCMGLEHAHAKGIVHRDVKPGNIMLTRTGRVKITDFGLAKLAQAQTQQTAANSILGTPLYMSPEQAFGESVDQRSDLFSLGTVLYECLTGRQPFHGESYMGVIQNIIRQNAPSPSKLGVEISSEVGAILAKAMSKNRDARFQSAREFRLAIENHLGLGVLKEATDGLKSLLATDGATMVLPRTELARRNTHRLKRVFAAASIAAAVSGAAVAGYFLSPDAMRGRIASVFARPAGTQPKSVTASPEGLLAAGMTAAFDVTAPSEGALPHSAPTNDGASPEDPAGTAAPSSLLSQSPIGPGTNGGESRGDTSLPAVGEVRDGATGRNSTATPDDGGMTGGGSPGEESRPEIAEVSHATTRDDARTTAATETTSEVAEVAKAGWLSVTTDPPAEIYIDERYIGDAPKTRIELTSGTHTLECRSPKHEPYRETLYITPGELSPRTIVLVKPVGRVSLSTIAGAEVHVDGVLVGITPLEGPLELDAGRHQLTIKKPGFHTWNTSISIDAQQLLPLRITLSPIY